MIEFAYKDYYSSNFDHRRHMSIKKSQIEVLLIL